MMNFQCDFCEAKLSNQAEKEDHTAKSHCKSRGILECNKCGKQFGSENILNIHLQFHSLRESCKQGKDVTIERDILYKEVQKQLEEVPVRKKVDIIPKPRRIYKPPSKRVGLTKIKMEDCLRCDACSCIYIDEKDYYKHMRNFHEKYNTMIPRTRRKSPTNIRPPSLPTLHSVTQQCQRNEKELVPNNINVKENIKNRWSQVLSQQLISPEEIKKEPEEMPEYCPLLCEVEVKIKTEPPEIETS